MKWDKYEGRLDSTLLLIQKPERIQQVPKYVLRDIKNNEFFVAVERCEGSEQAGHSFWAQGPVYSSKSAALQSGWKCQCKTCKKHL